MVQQNFEEETTNSENPLQGEQTARSEDLSGALQGELGESQPTEPKDGAEARVDFWSIQGDFIYRHHNEPRVQLCVPNEETFPTPLKYIDVTRSAHAALDVIQEKRVDYYRNVDSNRSLSDSLRGFTKITPLKEKPPKGYMWSGKRLTKVQTTARQDHVWPEVWTQIGNAAQNPENKNGKTRSQNSTMLDDCEKSTFLIPMTKITKKLSKKCEEKKLVRPVAAAMPRKKKARTSNTKVAAEVIASHQVPETICGCAVESHEPTRQRVEPSLPKNH